MLGSTFGKTTLRCFLVASVFGLATTPSVASAQEQVDQVIKVVSEDWNSLEITKLVIDLLIPAAMLAMGLWFDRRIKEFEHRQWSNQKVIEKRLEVYEKVTPKLNDMMCYFLRIGTWKEASPEEIIDMKRDIDKEAHIYAPLFSPSFMDRYHDFMGNCFATFRGEGLDAQLKADCSFYRDAYVGDEEEPCKWESEWDSCFTGPEEASSREDVSRSYRELVGLIAQELGVGTLDVQEARYTKQ